MVWNGSAATMENESSKSEVVMPFKKYKKRFGTTTDIREAGFILPSGEMLDFSGKRIGGTPRTRELDHSEISPNEARKHGLVSTHVDRDFSMVALRFGTEKQVTKEQWKTIRKMRKMSKKFHGKESVMVYDVYGKPNVYGMSPLLHTSDYGTLAKIKWALRGLRGRK